jgi:hypothetical protein
MYFKIAVPPSNTAASRRLSFSKGFGQSLTVENSTASPEEDLFCQTVDDDDMMEISTSGTYSHDQVQGRCIIYIQKR